MTHPSNDDRAQWADMAVAVFRQATGTDEHDAAADLICDLLHWCALHQQDPFEEVRRGIRMFMDERDYPPDGWAPEGKFANVDIQTWRDAGGEP